MSEIAKCPCCGDELAKLEPIQCLGWGCNFQCNPEDLHRIAAAMELAKACVKLYNSFNSGNYDSVEVSQEEFSDAENRVLEVFNG